MSAGFSADDYRFMAMALRLAERGLYTTRPNPRVGCVVVRGRELVGAGWHRRAGGAHAEVVALEEAGERAQGATAYVTLEPCSHQGRTPPCAEALIDAGVARVVVAVRDPNPLVAGRGIARLRERDIRVDEGLRDARAESLNAGFFKRHRVGMPWIRLKLATSLDGRTATASGESHWITGEAARRDVHRWRARSGAVLTGVGTVLADNPRLTARSLPGVPTQPARFVMDSRLRTPIDATLVRDGGGVTLLACRPDEVRQRALEEVGVTVWAMPSDAVGRVEVASVLGALARKDINEVLVECGPTLGGSLMQSRLVDELLIYVAPHLMGGEGRPLLALTGIDSMDDRLSLHVIERRCFGEDIRILARPGDFGAEE